MGQQKSWTVQYSSALINGGAIIVRAESRDEAERIAPDLIHKVHAEFEEHLGEAAGVLIESVTEVQESPPGS